MSKTYYNNKYQKYKNKYIYLKNQRGGVTCISCGYDYESKKCKCKMTM